MEMKFCLFEYYDKYYIVSVVFFYEKDSKFLNFFTNKIAQQYF